MRRLSVFIAIGTIAVASFTGTTTPTLASPVGTTFTWTATNFQGDSAGEVVSFGVPTLTTSGMVVGSMVTSVYPAVPAAGWVGSAGGGELIEFWLETGDGGFLSGDPGGLFAMEISGINWGPGMPAGEVSGVMFISFDIDGAPVDLDEANGAGAVIAPNPVMPGFDALVLTGVDGDPADTIALESADVLGLPIAAVLDAITTLPDVPSILSVNSMHFAFEVIHVPEPATMLLLGTGLASVLLVRRRRTM